MAVGGLPSHMQKLSISKPAAPIEPNLNNNGNSSQHLGSSPLHQYLQYQAPRFATPSSMLLQQHRSPRNMHSRSFSDYSHPYPQPLYSSAATSPPSIARDAGSPSRTSYLQPGYHRRAISTNTLDLILQPTHQHHSHDHFTTPPSLYQSSSTTTTTTCNSAPHSPTLSPTNKIPQSPVSSDGASDSDSNDKTTTTKSSTNKDASSYNKYHCPYCDKGFSRPSSLRIHTYSHTGEKPFVCPEPGCSRKFSVQSNMRRHLRVHRLGRATKRSNPSTATTATSLNMTPVSTTTADRSKPLAAKPTATWVRNEERHHLSAFTLPGLSANED